MRERISCFGAQPNTLSQGCLIFRLAISIIDIPTLFENIDTNIDKDTLEIIDIDKAILGNVNIDKGILENINILIYILIYQYR